LPRRHRPGTRPTTTGGPSPAKRHGAKFRDAAARRRPVGWGATRPPRPRSWVVFGAAFTLVAIADQLTKALARAALPLHQVEPIIGPWLGFRRTNYLPLPLHGSEVLAILGAILIPVGLFLVVWRGSWSQLDVVAALGTLLGSAASGAVDRFSPALSTQFLMAQLPMGVRIETSLSEIAFILGAAYLLLRVLSGDVPRERVGPDRARSYPGRD